MRVTGTMTDGAVLERLARASVAAIADLIDAADACIAGTVRARRSLFSPGRGAACVAYRFRDSTGHDEQRAVPFVLEDSSGDALIDPSHALLVTATHEGEGLHRSVVGASYLRRHGRPGTFHEQAIEVGQQIYVLGACVREIDMRAAGKLYRDRPGSQLRFVHRPELPLVFADQLREAVDRAQRRVS